MARHLLKIFLVVTILAGGASIYLGMELQKTRKGLETNLASETKIKEDTQKNLDDKKKELADKEKSLTDKKKELVDTNTELDKTKTALKTQEEQTKTAEQKNTQYSKDLTEKQAVIDNALKNLPPGTTAFDQLPGKFKELDDKFATLDQEKKVLNDQLVKIEKEKKDLEAKLNTETKPSSSLTGHILSVNEEWGFVVLDIGLNQGLNVGNHEMIVYRNGSFVGKIKTTKVEPSISIADILPDWKKADIQPGDTVVLN